MATVNFIPSHHQSRSSLHRVCSYVGREDKTRDRKFVSGIRCYPEFADKEFLATREMYRKESPVYYYHYTQSFSPEEDITPEAAHRIAKEFAEKAWEGCEVLVATHVDAPHIHSHFIVNAVREDNGKMLRQSPTTLKTLRALSDELCLKYGYSVIPKRESKQKGISAREYRSAVRGESWKFALMNRINAAMECAVTKDEFLEEMENEGYGVTWEESRKYITYQTPEGKRCRDRSLHDEKYLKGRMELEFTIREEIFHGRAPRKEQSRSENRSADRDRTNPVITAGASSGDAGNPLPTDSEDGDELTARLERYRRELEEALRRDGGHQSSFAGGQTGWEKERLSLLTVGLGMGVPQMGAPGDHAHGGLAGDLVRLGKDLESLQRDTPVRDATSLPAQTSRKQRQEQREKRIALGHKPDDHEDEKMTMKMSY